MPCRNFRIQFCDVRRPDSVMPLVLQSASWSCQSPVDRYSHWLIRGGRYPRENIDPVTRDNPIETDEKSRRRRQNAHKKSMVWSAQSSYQLFTEVTILLVVHTMSSQAEPLDHRAKTRILKCENLRKGRGPRNKYTAVWTLGPHFCN